LRHYKEHLIETGSIIKQALVQLDMLASDAILFVVNENDKLLGSLTDGDVRRGLLKSVSIDHLVDEIIQPHPRYIRKGERDINKVIEYRENNFRVVPILDKEDRIINVINFRELRSYLPVDTVIMAGGKGQRLKPLTDKTPKPLLKIGDKPIIHHGIDRFISYGIDDFYITVNYLGEQIEAYFRTEKFPNVSIDCVWEQKPMGTIGALTLIENFDHDFILLSNADVLTNLDYEQFFLDFLAKDADLAVLTIPYQVDVPYAVLETSNGHVISFKEKPSYTYYSNGGIYLMKKEVLKLIPEKTFYNATDLMERLINNGKKVISFPLMGYWLDMGKPEDFEKAQIDIDHIKF